MQSMSQNAEYAGAEALTITEERMNGTLRERVKVQRG
jgi:hypothetical protein